ncbi:MAG: HlyC/CorC family transporter [Pyrinomonadaceae bacterium]|nr:HlyC/CorC family transporter [Pyrinomonadaceae bacterium]MDQ3172735.1 hemolysin family protein [Acidobacteriota bacterium]
MLLVILLVLANGFFVASEFALVGVRRSRIAALAAGGNRRAKLLLELIDNLNAYISATQLGITMASLALGWIGEPVFAHLLEEPLKGHVSDAVLHTISFTLAFTIITFLHIVLGELAPKTLALERAERVSLAIARPLHIFYRIFLWPIRMLDWAGTRTVRLFGLHPSGEHASIYSADELRQLVNISRNSGHLKVDEEKLINRVFDFSEAEVREAMIPRTRVSALSLSASLRETTKMFSGTGYSRMPVYRDKMDNVAGIVFRRDIEPFLENPNLPFSLKDLIHPALFIPDKASLGAALKQLQANRTHLACVVDEHGGMEGIITLEDLLEEIVGEIDDEFDEESRAQIVKEHDSYLLHGTLAVRDANRILKLQLPEHAGYTTIAGFLMAQAGQVLKEESSIDYYGSRFIVERVEGRRIRRVRLILKASANHIPPSADASGA